MVKVVGDGAGLSGAPPTVIAGVTVMVPAVVPVASTTELGNVTCVVPRGTVKFTVLVRPAGVMNCTVESEPPTDEAKLTVRVPVASCGSGLPSDADTGACWAGAGDPEPRLTVTGGVAGALTVMETVAEAVCRAASVTVTVALELPAVVGVPLNAPLPFKVIPAGSDPAVSAKEYGVVPPEAVSVCENATPVVAVKLPPPNVTGLLGAVTVRLSCCRADCPFESVTTTMMSAVPAPDAAGVPLISPVLALSCNPAGSDPEASDHV